MAHTPKIGKLRSRLSFQTNTKTQNAQYGFDYIWTDVMTIWGEIKRNPGLLYSRGDNLEPLTNYLITVRYRTDITRDMRILNNGNEYTIHGIIPLEEGNKRFIMLYAELKDIVT